MCGLPGEMVRPAGEDGFPGMTYFLALVPLHELTRTEKGNYDVFTSLADKRLDRERHGALVERGIYMAKLVSRIQRSFTKLEWRGFYFGHHIINTYYQMLLHFHGIICITIYL